MTDHVTRARAILAASTPGTLAPRWSPDNGYCEIRVLAPSPAACVAVAEWTPEADARALVLARNVIEALLAEHEAAEAIARSQCVTPLACERGPRCAHCTLYDAHERAAAVLREEVERVR